MKMISWLLCTVLLMAACAGTEARQEVLGPTLGEVAPHVVEDALHADAVSERTLADFERAVQHGNWQAALDAWPQVRAWAEAGIEAKVQAGTISPGVADSLRERLHRYEQALQRQKGQTSWRSRPDNSLHRWSRTQPTSTGKTWPGTSATSRSMPRSGLLGYRPWLANPASVRQYRPNEITSRCTQPGESWTRPTRQMRDFWGSSKVL